MKQAGVFSLSVVFWFALLTHGKLQSKVYPLRWVFVTKSLQTDQHVAEIREIAVVAARHGLNGMVLSVRLDRLELQPPEYVERVRKVKAIADEHKLELIPQIFSAGYGGSVLGFDKNLAEGLPVKGALFVVNSGEARFEPDSPVELRNGAFDEYLDSRVTDFEHQETGAKIAIDTAVKKDGQASLRLEAVGAERGQARVSQHIEVRPYRAYRLTGWVRTESLDRRTAFRIQVLTADARNLTPFEPRLQPNQDWTKITVGFNSRNHEKLRVVIGAALAQPARLWMDEFHLEEVGLVNVLRRPGTPVIVRSDAGVAVRSDTGDRVYEEGRDFAPISDPNLDHRFDHDGPTIRILPGSRIKSGERLRVDYYHSQAIMRGQVTVCMSEPKLFEIWEEQARRIHQLLAPRRYLLSMDEIRLGGTDESCKRQTKSMAEILGQTFRRQVAMIRKNNPKAEIFTWSDMLDPNHNARANYYLVEGDYTGSWKYVPRDLRIVAWYYNRRKESLEHFSRLGFQTLAGAYYDGETVENPRGWLEALDRTPGALGIMYTTWENKYGLLPAFGDLVSKRPGSAGVSPASR